MTLIEVNRNRYPSVQLPTSGTGSLQWARDVVISVGGALGLRGTAPDRTFLSMPTAGVWAEQTSGGCASSDGDASTSAAIGELRRRSGLTWEQLARMFRVTRRSIHLWASGKPMSVTDKVRLGRLLTVIRRIDRGTASETRMALVTDLPEGVTPFDLLLDDAFDEVTERLGPRPAPARPTLSPLDFSAMAAKTTASPAELVGARHNRVHQQMGRSRAARSVKAKGERDGQTR